MNNDKLPEAPASVTYNVITPKGFPALVTVRDAEYKELVTKMVFMEEWFIKNGYKPQQQRMGGGFPKKETQYVEGRVCPKCGGRLVIKDKDGKKFYPCENQKYDFKTGVKSGCTYIDWGDLKKENIVADKFHEIGNKEEDIPVGDYTG